MTAGSDDMFSSNRASFAQRQATQEQLRATQEELATKIRELQIYESNFLQLKKELARWKKKFEFVFRENELLSVETAKLDASHKQIAFLQQELQFKAEESEALRGLVSALEAANKKARATRLDSAASRLASRRDLPETTAAGVALLDANGNRSTADSDDAARADEDGDQSRALETERRERAAERERLQREVAALQQENALLLKDLDRRAASLQLSEEQLAAHKQRIAALEDSLQVEQDKHMAQLREKQERIVALEEQILSLEQQRRRRSSAAVDHEDVGFGPTHRLQHRRSLEKKASGGDDGDVVDEEVDGDDGDDDDDDEPDTPPGTPPPISAGGLLPDVDPTVDQVLRDWEDVKRVRAAPASAREAAAENWARVQLSLLERLPFEAKDGATRVLQSLLDPAHATTEFPESQVLVRAVPPECLHELQTFVVPLLKAHAHVRVTYATLQRRTLVTDVRLTLERRGEEYTGGLEKRLGRDHAFLGPSLDDPTRLVMHTPRVLTTEKKAVYVSKPQLQELQRALSTSMTSEHSTPPPPPPMTPGDEAANTSQTSEPDGTTTAATAAHGGKKWRVPNALTLDKTKKLMGTMVAGAKQRVARRQQLKVVHEGTSCQFCKVSPIVGHRYSCATCVGFDLCENCYALGGHGLENSDELFYRAQELVLLRCPRLADELELLELLRFEICRSNLRKFSFCLNWLADIVNGKTSQQLQARALEIPGIRRDVRKQFVPLLLRVCSDREDLEVKTEWELESDNAAEVKSVATAGTRGGASALGGEGDNRFLETLRIWVADQYRTTSPFVERSLLKFREGITVEGEDSDDDGEDHDRDGGAHSDSEARDRFSSSGGDRRGDGDGSGATRRRAATAAPRMSHANGAFPRRNPAAKRGPNGDASERAKERGAAESDERARERNDAADAEEEDEEEERMASSRRGFTERNRMMSQEF
ncbi:hypothetical protein PINS_up003287 [Pythium insidiosum]|nr:hypothetical protein PINS_up003287 [Pythium insidiosum]